MNILRTSRQALRLAFTMVVALLVSAVMTITGLGAFPAYASDWNPPSPIPDDNCGTKWDRYRLIEQSGTVYRVNDEPVAAGVWLSTSGAATVTVVAKNYFDPDKTFTFTFGTEPDASCQEAKDTVQLTATGCGGDGYVSVVVTFTNVADSSGWSRTETALSLERWDGKSGRVLYHGPEIPDGGTYSWTSLHILAAGSSNGWFSNMMPGTYEVWLDETASNPRKVQLQSIFVPDLCGKFGVPPGDPSGLGGPGGTGGNGGNGNYGGIGSFGGTKPLPRIKVKQAGCTVKVKLDNRKVRSAVLFRVTLKPAKGKTFVRTVKVKPGARKVVKRHHFVVPGRAKVVYKLAGKKYVKKQHLVGCSR